MTSPPLPSSDSRRRAILMCSVPNAVPQVATAVGIPARWQAITSVYPSTTTSWRSLAMLRLARSIP
ncbi:hypothetical protein AHiyo4_15910 [Arthrobacter sp. Hiyo4]|nr:hypothetical protein AHiyo4_15910 [Arthrobacter sp. Hiyo4]